MLIFLFSRDDKILGMRPLLDAIAVFSPVIWEVSTQAGVVRTPEEISCSTIIKTLFGTLDLDGPVVFMNITASALGRGLCPFQGQDRPDRSGDQLGHIPPGSLEDGRCQGRNLLSIVLASREVSTTPSMTEDQVRKDRFPDGRFAFVSPDRQDTPLCEQESRR